MDNITYIILLKNQSKNLPDLANSIKALNGNFRKEFVVIDDASTDDTMRVSHEVFSSLPKCTILSNDTYHGPSYSINKAFALSHGKFIHFVDGDEVLDPDSTISMLNACKSLGGAAACGLYGKIDKEGNRFKSPYETGDSILLENPIKNILDNSVHDIRKFGFSGTLIGSFMFEEMGGADEHIFTHNMSMALTAAKFTKFSFVKKTLSYSNDNVENRYDKKFLAHNNLQAIANFMEDHTILSENYAPEIYKALWSILWNLDKKHKVKSLPKYFLSRYMKSNLDVKSLIELYNGYIDQLQWM